MANVLPARPRMMTQRRTFAVVASQYNPVYVQGLVENFRKEMEVLAPQITVTVTEVPGAFEIPIVAQELAGRAGIDAVIAFGVIMQGATHHAELISTSVTQALMQIALANRVPVIHEVLVVLDDTQAKERCLDPQLNRGIEAARAAVRVVQALSEVRSRS